MRTYLILVFMASFSACSTLQDTHRTPADYSRQSAFQQKIQSNEPLQEISPALQKQVGEFNYVFIGPWNSESLPAVFTDAEATLKLRFAVERVYRIYPLSTDSVSTAARRLKDRLESAYRVGGGKPLIVFGYSLGGATGLLTLLQNPELLRSGKVAQYMSIQGAIGGSYLADQYDELCKTRVGDLIEWASGFCDDPMIANGMRSMRTDRIRPLLTSALQRFSHEERAELGRKIFYIRSKLGAVISKDLRGSAKILDQLVSNGHDGLVATDDQFHPSIGRDLGVILGDHYAIALPSPKSAESSATRDRFFTLLIFELFHWESNPI